MSEKKALTEAQLIERLRVRYTQKTGNGEAWAFIPKVRSAAAFDARRTIDAYAMSLWPSRGLSLYAFEIKSSRSDWLRELKNPEKAEEFCELADFFYMVVGDKDIVKPGELPDTWGLLVPHGGGLKAEVEAPALRDLTNKNGRAGRDFPPGFSRSFLAAAFRAACAVGDVTPVQIREAEQRVREAEQSQASYRETQQHEQLHELRERVRIFQQASGVDIGRWGTSDPAKIGDAVRMVLNGESNAERLEDRIQRLCQQAQSIADHASELLKPGGAE